MDLTSISPSILKSNRSVYVRQLSASSPATRESAQSRIDAIDAELIRRKERKSHKGATAGYVLTAKGQFEHRAGEREGFTKCGVAIDPNRTHGTREWWHCLLCER